jgi:hypothetical protein
MGCKLVKSTAVRPMATVSVEQSIDSMQKSEQPEQESEKQTIKPVVPSISQNMIRKVRPATHSVFTKTNIHDNCSMSQANLIRSKTLSLIASHMDQEHYENASYYQSDSTQPNHMKSDKSYECLFNEDTVESIRTESNSCESLSGESVLDDSSVSSSTNTEKTIMRHTRLTHFVSAIPMTARFTESCATLIRNSFSSMSAGNDRSMYLGISKQPAVLDSNDTGLKTESNSVDVHSKEMTNLPLESIETTHTYVCMD